MHTAGPVGGISEKSDARDAGGRASPAREWVILGLLLLVPLAAQLARPVPRIGADAIEYYSQVRSLALDGDLRLDEEYTHFNILTRGDKVQPTATGYRRTVFSVGTALLWLPFFYVGHFVAWLTGQALDGYSAAHVRSVMLGSLAFGLAGLLLVYRVLRRFFDVPVSLLTVALLLYATSLFYYVVYEPLMSHAASFFLGALIVLVACDRGEDLSLARAAGLGLLIGVASLVRSQNSILLLLPAVLLLPMLRRRTGAGLLRGGVLFAAFVLATVPQMLAWKAIFGTYVLPYPPQGPDYVQLGHPRLLETLFSSRHGLLFWTPVLWAGLIGLVGLVRRRPLASLALLVPLVAMGYVNACIADWWGGGSFSNRRYDSVLPLLAVGLAATVSWTRQLVARRPTLVVTVVAAAFVAWNALLMHQYARNWIPADDTVALDRLAQNAGRGVRESLGTPLAWPANWLFGLTHGLPPGSYDLMVGKYLFHRQNNLGGVVEIGTEDRQADLALLGEGWTPRRDCGSSYCRAIEGRARLFVALDEPEALDVAVRATGSGTLAMAINGADAGTWPLTTDLADLRARVPADRFRRELNEVSLTVAPGGSCLVDRVVFQRMR
jgi:hypothetical protein